MRVVVVRDYKKLSRWAADYVAARMAAFGPTAKRPFVLGLPTGSTPEGMYRRLVSLHKKAKLSFANVVTFNMDEYVGLEEDHPQSYHVFMRTRLFNHVDAREENIHIPDGNAADLDRECRQYEEKIEQAGGIHLFIGGIGHDGHLAFNEPGSGLASRTRVATLTDETIRANARFFGGDTSRVPRYAITVGVATIMDAEEVMILASGAGKAQAVREMIEGPVSQMCTASALQMHPRALVVCDEDATLELKVGTVKYYKQMERDYDGRL